MIILFKDFLDTPNLSIDCLNVFKALVEKPGKAIDLPFTTSSVDLNINSDIPLEKLQVIVNEYMPGQGISQHIDDVKQFGDWIISISLGSAVNINFTKGDIVERVYVEGGSLYEMKDDARYKWKHSIPARKSDNNIDRTTRISLTFRKTT